MNGFYSKGRNVQTYTSSSIKINNKYTHNPFKIAGKLMRFKAKAYTALRLKTTYCSATTVKMDTYEIRKMTYEKIQLGATLTDGNL